MNLKQLAKQINAAHERCLKGLRMGAAAGIEAGKLLLQAQADLKKERGYGAWGRWIEDNLSFSDRTARWYMRVAREASVRQFPAELTMSQITALIADVEDSTEDLDEYDPLQDPAFVEMMQLQDEGLIDEGAKRRIEEAQADRAAKFARKLATLARIAAWFHDGLRLVEAAERIEEVVLSAAEGHEEEAVESVTRTIRKRRAARACAGLNGMAATA